VINLCYTSVIFLGFWKIRLFKKYHTIIFFIKLQNSWKSKWRRPLQFMLDHNFCIFQPNMFWKHNFISHPFSFVWWFLFSKWRKYPRWRFSDFLCFSGVLNCKLLNLLFQNMIYWISINHGGKISIKNKMACDTKTL
jgi:hypothetical protein